MTKILSDEWVRLTVVDTDTGEELAVITNDPKEAITAKRNIAIKLSPSRD